MLSHGSVNAVLDLPSKSFKNVKPAGVLSHGSVNAVLDLPSKSFKNVQSGLPAILAFC